MSIWCLLSSSVTIPSSFRLSSYVLPASPDIIPTALLHTFKAVLVPVQPWRPCRYTELQVWADILDVEAEEDMSIPVVERSRQLSQYSFKLVLIGILKVNDEKDPDRLVIGMDPRIRIRGSTPKCHGSATLALAYIPYF